MFLMKTFASNPTQEELMYLVCLGCGKHFVSGFGGIKTEIEFESSGGGNPPLVKWKAVCSDCGDELVEDGR